MYLKNENEREGCVVAYLLSFAQEGSLLPTSSSFRLFSLALLPLSSRNVCVGVVFVLAKLGEVGIYRQVLMEKVLKAH